MKESAVSLKQIAKVLGWIDESLGWIAEPLQRTAVALMKLTPAVVAEKKAVCMAADAISVAAEAVKADSAMLSHEGRQRLAGLPVAMPRQDASALVSISVALNEAATFLKGDMSKGPPSYLTTFAKELEKSQPR